MHEDVVAVLVVAVQHDVPAGPCWRCDELDRARVGRHHGCALGGDDVLALVTVTLAAGAEARVVAAEVKGARHREHVTGLGDRGSARAPALGLRASLLRPRPLLLAGDGTTGARSRAGERGGSGRCRAAVAGLGERRQRRGDERRDAEQEEASPNSHRRHRIGMFSATFRSGRISCFVHAILQRPAGAQAAAIRDRSSIAPRLLSGSLRLPHLGDCTQDGQPARQRHSLISRSASPTRPSKRSYPRA